MRDRRINRRQQGDLGEASAIEWLTSRGATVLLPLGHSPHYDLVAELGDRLYRIQVKTSTCRARRSDARCFAVQIATLGGNQSWTGTVKRFDPSRVEFLFVLVGDGRRWLIPSPAVEGRRAIHLGGPKYSEYEIAPGNAIQELVYGGSDDTLVESDRRPGEYRSGQPGGAVNAMAYAFAGSNPASPTVSSRNPVKPTKYERKLGQAGHAIINQKRRLTIPQRAFFEAGFQNGSKVRVQADGAGRIVCEQLELPDWGRPPVEENHDGPP